MDNPKKHAAAAAADSGAAGASNKRFKHFHQGPNASAQDEEEKKQNSVAAAPTHASPISGLCSDELGAMLDFLARTDLSRALAVSRSWSAFIRSSMPCIGFGVQCTAESVVEMSSSALARHITHIAHTDTVRCKLTSDSLCILALAMPQLIFLQCELIPSKARKMILPAKLKTLELDVSALDAASINRALTSIGQLAALSELTLLMSTWLPEVSFGPLSKCAALRELTVKPPSAVKWNKQPSDAQIEQLRALHQLHSVTIHPLVGDSLAKLLHAPHSLQWRAMSVLGGVFAVALRNLPGLVKLHTWACRDVSFLPTLPQLQTLQLQIKEKPWAVTADTLVESLSSCHQLTYLSLIAPVTSKHLTALLPHLPQLHIIVLFQCSELESLAFLSAVPSLQRSLRRFMLSECTHPALRSSELSHVVTLKQLDALHLIQSFADPLDGFTQRLLTPPSSMLPKLTVFKFAAAPTAAPAAAP